MTKACKFDPEQSEENGHFYLGKFRKLTEGMALGLSYEDKWFLIMQADLGQVFNRKKWAVKVETKCIKYVGKELCYDRSSMMVKWDKEIELPKGLIMDGFLCHVNVNGIILCTARSHWQ